MKSIANRLFVVAAAALSLGTAAYGQSPLKANVPFAFRAQYQRGVLKRASGHCQFRWTVSGIEAMYSGSRT
jgi:hypothetical protein